MKERLDLSPKTSCLLDKPLEGNVVAEKLKQTVTGYEALVHSTAAGSDESLPPNMSKN